MPYKQLSASAIPVHMAVSVHVTVQSEVVVLHASLSFAFGPMEEADVAAVILQTQRNPMYVDLLGAETTISNVQM